MTTGTQNTIDQRPTLTGLQRVARVIATAVLSVANFFVVLYLPYLAIWAGGGPWVNDASYVEWNWAGYGFVPTAVATIVWLGYLLGWGWLASRVDYRMRDALIWLIPPAGLIISVLIFYRLCGYRVRNWPPAPDPYPIGRIEARLRRLLPWST